jgi:phenylalanyl-tRNA synthetase beta chain
VKFSEKWLREWVSPSMETDELAHRLTMIGHEVDSLELHGAGLDGVVVGEVLESSPHPNADRLLVCQVSTGGTEVVEVVCGAPNVRDGMKSPFAPVGSTLLNGSKLKKAKIRGVVSNGMLCSAIEIGLGDDADGIVELDGDAPTGQPLADYLDLPDVSFDLDLTPNRGDCFSVLGIAREVAALTSTPMKSAKVEPVPASTKDTHPVDLVYPEGCPRFGARIVRNIDMSAESPSWMKERLRRSGLRSIHPVVDVTNYVMLELGQPLHAYDLARLDGPIRPRLAKKGEKLTLLDDKEVELLPNTLVITDDRGAIGMAGIMGGLSTAVTDETRDVFFEAAFFTPAIVAGVARQYGMHTDASIRFERGVDPHNQVRAIERATELLTSIAGGEAGPLVDHHDENWLPKSSEMSLRKSRLRRILGVEIPVENVTRILTALGLDATENNDGWLARIPSYRFDIDVEDALVEEVARIYGYDEIPEITATVDTPLASAPEEKLLLDDIAATLVARDYQEVITYSFIDEEIDCLITGNKSELVLKNAISSEMSVMRGSVWPGLIDAASVNGARQQERIRLFEIGKTFHGAIDAHQEVVRVSAIVAGEKLEKQWGSQPQAVDFFDIKSDVAALIGMTGATEQFKFTETEHPALQSGQAAKIIRGGVEVGVVGKLHPTISKRFDLEKGAYLFEVDAERCFAALIPVAETVSKFPSIRRDIAVIVKDKVRSSELVEAAESAVPELVRDVRIFDVYKGPSIEEGLKSIALGLILQGTSRTLTDEDADAVMTTVLGRLKAEFGAELRD